MLKVNVVSATEQVWEGEASQVVASTTEGSIGIRPGHTPVLATLGAGEVRVTTASGKVVSAQAEGGFLSVSNDLVSVIAGEAAVTE
ncbi:F0F1 ATP synthase subunit epsilon [Gulosibacter sp. 10]|uniref:F0F1 ATP synthase subunit epsilon n=1 Tax=Gulosibacter sp. 10 TaxID=1255570 RepID=UPI00097EE7E6|nr:F0F1 ATP synthase subunit epsilon [Gulosibacter sp. 10]SJM57756.1 ATP synthase epsilon chain [Gulosibacter sp. 10]